MFTNAKLLCYNAQYEKGSEGNSVCGIDRKPMSPTESISMEETYNGEHSGAGLLNMRSEQESRQIRDTR